MERKTLNTRAKIILNAQSTIAGDMPSFYAPISVTVSARSSNEAGTKALDDLDLLRGIWNLFNNRRHTIRISSGVRSPVNAMILGPVHTLHKMNGEHATDAWWYEPTYRGPVRFGVMLHVSLKCSPIPGISAATFKMFLIVMI